MTDTEKKAAAKKFADYWKNRGSERQESQTFWNMLLRDVLGVIPEEYIHYEEKVTLDHTSFIDAVIDKTHVFIKQKSSDKDLNKPIRQSDGSLLTAKEQAFRYANSSSIGYYERPRWIVTCNFREMYIYDMARPNADPEKIVISDLPKEYYRLQFLVESENDNVKKEFDLSMKAGDIVGELYNELLKQYHNPEDNETLKSLNILCVRLVFCLYAEDAGLFGSHTQFHDYIKGFAIKDTRRALIDLFKVLNIPEDKRSEYDPYLNDELNAFPYVNGGLFAGDIEIPPLTENIVHLLLSKASEDFNWSEISPTIFGAVFESTLNPETRRNGGMHYTSIENIHKVIDPLFLDDLKEELKRIAEIKIEKERNKKLDTYREKLSKLTFLDPACGSGNFLTETYLSLRRLENEALKIRQAGQIAWEIGGVIKVSIGQFYGIEINDFAVTVAKTALWIAESQMIKATEEIVKNQISFLPLKSYANIVEGNALRLDWESVVPKEKLNYIMGNPPFVGARRMTEEQKADLFAIFSGWKNIGNLDYVACWYKKAADYISHTSIRCALVSTNSVAQGEQVDILWKPLFEMGVHIDFAHRTFRWDSEANIKAHVHCVIVGFSIAPSTKNKILYDGERSLIVGNINGYLINAENVFIESRRQPICDVPPMVFGSMPNDGGYLSNYDEEKKNDILRHYPQAESCFRWIYGSEEFINNNRRWCLWLKDISPNLIRSIPPIKHAVEKVRETRANSNRAATNKLALTPTLFGEIRQPESGDYLLVPRVSSERRKYIPIGFIDFKIIAADSCLLVPNATLYHFGVLTSNVHMAWMRAVCGRLKSDYRYSASIVYNNFPWSNPTEEQKAKIEQTAQGILDARAHYPDCSLADLYDPLSMPLELLTAHQHNDKAVMAAYGFPIKMTESECVAELMKMYQTLTL